LIKNASPNGDEMLLNGKAPLQGQIIKLQNLAQTFREVATHGKDGFYKGRVAQAIVELIQSKGGLMELDDLAKHKTTFVDPIKYTYANAGKDDGVTLYEVGVFNHRNSIFSVLKPLSSALPTDKVKLFNVQSLYPVHLPKGLTALIALGILENLQEQGTIKPLLEMEHNSAEYLHVLIEALRFVLDRRKFFAFLTANHRLAFAGKAPSCFPNWHRSLCIRHSVVCCGSGG
jgi:gamma-glutamyltranspeptidase/glutathione hydrolase